MSRIYYRLVFPEKLEHEAVIAFVHVLGGLPNKFNGSRGSSAVVFEIWADKKGVHHRIGLPDDQKHLIEQLRSSIRGLHTEPDEGLPLADFTAVGEFGLSSKTKSLQLEKPDRIKAVSRSLLTSLQPVGPGEVTLIQWVVAPTAKRAPGRSLRYTPSTEGMLGGVQAFVNESLQGIDDRRQANIKEKYKGYMFSAVCRVGVRSTAEGSTRSHFASIANALQSSGGRGVGFRQTITGRFSDQNDMKERIEDAATPKLTWPCLLNANELSAMMAFPIDSPNVPGLQLGGSYQAAPSSDIPEDGRVLAASTYGGSDRPLAIPWQETARHFYVVGSNGSGKTTLLENCALQDMQHGMGVIYIDPKGDSAKRLLDCVPEERAKDVIYFDPTNREEVVGLNLLAGGERNPDLVTDNVVGMLKKLYADSWGARLETYLRGAVRTLAPIPDMTMYEVATILTNDRFRDLVLSRFKVSIALKDFWDDYKNLSPSARQEALGPIMNKLQAFTLRDDVRHIIAQSGSALDMDKVLSERKILIMRLPKGELGPETAPLLGSTAMMLLWAAVQRRPEADRKDFCSCYVDECQDFLNLPTPLETILAQGRGFGFPLTLANQHLGQLGSSMQKDVLANANSQLFFRLSAADAKAVAPQFGTAIRPEDLTSLGQYEAMISISTGGEYRSKPTVGRTYPGPEMTGSMAEALEATRPYMQNCEAVDDAILQRREAWDKRPTVGSREVTEGQ